jgi:hypothetical protein
MGINIYSIWQIYLSLFRQNDIKVSIPIIAVIVVIIFLLNYFIFHYKERYQLIVDKYSKESDRERRIGIIIGYLYTITTITLLFFAKHLEFS